jgi:ribonucleoside-diphosphate reductase alpha chain
MMDMPVRDELPNRRRTETCEIDVEGVDYSVSVGLYDDGRPGEIFVAGMKVGSQMDGILADAAILASNCLQRGMTAAQLAGAMSASTPIGAALACAADMAAVE